MVEYNTFVSDDNPKTSSGGCPILILAGTPAALNEVCRVFPQTREAYPAIVHRMGPTPLLENPSQLILRQIILP
jgi:hypothetical protein